QTENETRGLRVFGVRGQRNRHGLGRVACGPDEGTGRLEARAAVAERHQSPAPRRRRVAGAGRRSSGWRLTPVRQTVGGRSGNGGELEIQASIVRPRSHEGTKEWVGPSCFRVFVALNRT